ncbi:MAG TPA: thiamine pyrophosphate-dependent dehydrogenase E1 component subunit alpha [Candidatus Sulfotelmatobacter sp.]|nr:thiamine pyrophosphate-dependent dehydrogenase E1 component subunit alpha [Candidatus Sulfotelmatobacter sp.]
MRSTLVDSKGASFMRTMIRIRLFEERLAELFAKGGLPGVVHLSIGEEASAVGICGALEPGDQITSTHRGHHHMLARGLEVEPMFAEILGKATGYCRGKGGSMHVAAVHLGAAGANGIVGGGVPIAVGLGIAARQLGTDRIGVAFFGDGGANQGVVHESLNLAAVWKVPVVFVCENNGYGEFTRTESVTAGPGIAQRAEGYGIPGVQVDGADAIAVHEAAVAAVGRARAGDGPTLIESRMQRWRGHHEGEEAYAGVYREPAIIGRDTARDPLDVLEAAITAAGMNGGSLRAQLTGKERQLIDRSLAAAQAAPLPDPQTALEDVFA